MVHHSGILDKDSYDLHLSLDSLSPFTLNCETPSMNSKIENVNKVSIQWNCYQSPDKAFQVCVFMGILQSCKQVYMYVC